MSFECKHYNSGHCELLEKKCSPMQKGCVLIKSGAYFVGEEKTKLEKKDKK